MLTRRPAPRPWDVIALEVLLTLACAIQVGLMLWLSIATWDDRGAGGVVVGALAVVAVAVAAGWFLWLTGVTGWLLAGASAAAGLQVAFLLVLGSAGEVVGIDPWALLISLAAAIIGGLCGVFLPAPSSRRYRPAPRARESAGGPPSAPRVSPQVVRAADRYARPVAAGAAALTAAGVKRASRSGGTGSVATAEDAAIDGATEPVMQPRPGTPIRTSGPTDPDIDAPATPAATSPSAGASPTPGLPAAPRTSVAAVAAAAAAAFPPRPITAPGPAVAPTMAVPGTGATRTTSRAGTPPPDPGAIARQARAAIDAELATPARPSVRTPGFRLVDPPPPATRVKPPSADAPRLSPVSRPPGARPPRGRPVGRVGDVQQPADPAAVDPVFRSVPPVPPPAQAPGPTADTLPFATFDTEDAG